MATQTPVADGAKPDAVKKDSVKEVTDLRDKLFVEWNKGPTRNMNTILGLLEQAKLELVECNYLERRAGNVPEAELIVARDILEIGTFYSILQANPDTKLFERYMSQLKTYYFDYETRLKESPRKYEILGANLLRLLTEGLLTEFHIELELILHPVERIEELLQNIYIKRAVDLSQALEEGRYANITEQEGPHQKSALWHHFITKLRRTSRVEMADTLERAYDRFEANELLHMLGIASVLDQDEFMQTRDWTLQNGFYHFKVDHRAKHYVPSTRLVEQALAYAKDMETII